MKFLLDQGNEVVFVIFSDELLVRLGEWDLLVVDSFGFVVEGDVKFI